MNDLTEFKNQIIKYGVIVAAAMAVISLICLGPRLDFLAGLAAGTVVTIINFHIMVFTGKKVSETQQRLPAVVGYIIRLPIYGITFYLCIRVSLLSAAGCALGFLTVVIAIFYIYGIKSRFPGARKNPLNESDEPREWNNLDEDGWDEDDDWNTQKETTLKEKK